MAKVLLKKFIFVKGFSFKEWALLPYFAIMWGTDPTGVRYISFNFSLLCFNCGLMYLPDLVTTVTTTVAPPPVKKADQLKEVKKNAVKSSATAKAAAGKPVAKKKTAINKK